MPNPLGEFLSARRANAALGPSAGDNGRRRRVTGLRREEVSVAAGISVDYYTRLEQGRESHPSDAVLNALARTLGLTPDATQHLYRLRDANPADGSVRERDEALLTGRMTAIVEAVRPNPAYILDRLSNMIAANTEGLALFEGFAEIAPSERNTCRYLMLDPRARAVFTEWEEIARGAVAHLRAANADVLGDPALQALVSELSDESPEFDDWWGEHIVERRRSAIAHLRAADGLTTVRRYEVLHLPEDGLRMTLWLPVGD